jgi:hypothetical protein
VSLVQLVRFLVVKLTHTCSNSRFDMSAVFTANHSFSGSDIPINSDALFETGFMNLKIKPTQSFRDAHRDTMCVHVFIGMRVRTCMSIKKKEKDKSLSQQ